MGNHNELHNRISKGQVTLKVYDEVFEGEEMWGSGLRNARVINLCKKLRSHRDIAEGTGTRNED